MQLSRWGKQETEVEELLPWYRVLRTQSPRAVGSVYLIGYHKLGAKSEPFAYPECLLSQANPDTDYVKHAG